MNPLTPAIARDARMSLLAVGAGSVVAQIVLLREVLATFAGSEITAAVALGLWLVCTGVGSMLGARLDSRPFRLAGDVRPPRRQLAATHLALAFLPFAMLAAVRALPLAAGVRGAAIGLPWALVGSLAVFLPYGLLSGGMVPTLGRLSSGAHPDSVGLGERSGVRWAYALDSAGSAAGGLLLGVALAVGLPHGICLAVAGSSHVWMALRHGFGTTGTRHDPPRAVAGNESTATRSRRPSPLPGSSFTSPGHALAATQPQRFRFLPWRTVLAAIALVIALFSVGPWIDHLTIGWRYPGQEVLLVRDTPFGQIAVTRIGTQRNLLQDAIPLTSTDDLSAETRVHPPLCQVPEGASVLLVGGSIAGSLRVAMLHRPRQVDCVETDAVIFRLGRSSTGAEPSPFFEPALDSRIVRTFAGDGRAFIRHHLAVYDAIVLHLPGPENAQLNRFYTEEFFREAHAALRPGGVLSFLLASSPNYLGAEQLALERSITAALGRSFSEITVLPGESHLYMAGDRPANLDLEPTLAARGIVTTRLLDYDWGELSDPFRRDELRDLLFRVGTSSPEDVPRLHQRATVGSEIDRPRPRNRDLAPAAFRHFLDLRARLDAGGTRLVPAIIAASILIALVACVPGRRSQPAAAGALGTVPACGPTRQRRPAPAVPDLSRPQREPSTAILVAVATSGFAAMAMELAVLLLFQVIFGSLYLRLSLLITLLLAGAAVGALAGPWLPWTARVQIRLADAATVLIAVALFVVGKSGTGGFAVGALGSGTQATVRWIAGYLLLPALTLLAAAPMGVQFAAAGRVARGAPSPLGRLYLADLAGAASGTMVVGLWLLPGGGVSAVLAVVVAIKAASLGLQFLTDLAQPASLEPGRIR